MARKNISTGVDNAAAVVDLGDDDEIVKKVTTETVVGRRKRPTVAEPLPLDTSFEIEPDENVIDVTDEQDDDEPEYSENSLAALIYDDDNENRVDNKFCSVAVRRNPDSMNDKFRNPCGAVTNYPPLRNIELTADRMDIEDKVRAENGGGHYFFQIHLNGRLGPSWKATLSDDPKIAADERGNFSAAMSQPAAQSPPPVVDPLDSLLASVDKFARLKEVFGGGDAEKVKMEMQIEQLRHEIEAAKNAPAERKSERLTLFEAALAAGSASPLQSKILDNLFPSEEKESRHWAAELLEVAIQNKEVIFEVAGPLLASFLGAGRGVNPPLPPPGMPQQIPPPAFPPPPPMQSMFAPRTPEPFEQPPAFEPMPAFDAMPLPEPPATEPKPEIDPVFEPDTTAIIQADEPKPGVDIRHDDEPATPPKRIRHAKFKKDEENETDAAAKP